MTGIVGNRWSFDQFSPMDAIPSSVCLTIYDGGTKDFMRTPFQELVAQINGIKAMAAAGIKLVAGGDFGHQWTKHGTYAAEMQRYVDQCGLSPIAAIHTATRNFADLMGLDVGEVRAGAMADLLVVDGDPTADITVLQQPDLRSAVIKGGAFAYVNPAVYP